MLTVFGRGRGGGVWLIFGHIILCTLLRESFTSSVWKYPPPQKKQFTGFFGIHHSWLHMIECGSLFELYPTHPKLNNPPPPPRPHPQFWSSFICLCVLWEEGGYFINHWSMQSYSPKANISSLRGAILGDSERCFQCGHGWDWASEKKNQSWEKGSFFHIVLFIVIKTSTEDSLLILSVMRHFEH